jgi:hypothetical protein
MKITKGTPHYDPNTNEVVITHLEMEDVHDGVLRLHPNLLRSLLDLVPTGDVTQRLSPLTSPR